MAGHPNASNITPKKEASQLDFLRRQFFVTPPATSSNDVKLEGKTAIVTGSNVGLGFHCSQQLLSLGLSKLILAVRDEAKGNVARQLLLSKVSNAVIEVWSLDLSGYDSVRAFVERTKTLERLDIVVLNAGVFKTSYQVNPSTNHEEVLQVNYLSTALLTILLLPVMKEKSSTLAPSRVVLVNSETAAWAKFKERDSSPLFKAMDKKETFDMLDRYYTSKLLGQLFIAELTKRVPTSVAVITVCNPGFCYGSHLHHETYGTISGSIFAAMKRMIGRSIPVGARTLTDAATKHGQEVHGQYLGDCVLKPMAPLVYDPQGSKLGESLWGETMTELSFANVEEIIRELGVQH